jgi:hypothetical protein
MDIGASEAEAFWTEFLRELRRRGLRSVKLVVSSAHEHQGRRRQADERHLAALPRSHNARGACPCRQEQAKTRLRLHGDRLRTGQPRGCHRPMAKALVGIGIIGATTPLTTRASVPASTSAPTTIRPPSPSKISMRPTGGDGSDVTVIGTSSTGPASPCRRHVSPLPSPSEYQIGVHFVTADDLSHRGAKL